MLTALRARAGGRAVVILTYKYRIKDRRARKELRRQAWAVNQ